MTAQDATPDTAPEPAPAPVSSPAPASPPALPAASAPASPPGDAPASAPGPRKGLLRRLALDTRPLAVPAYRRLLLGQSAALVGTMVTETAVPVQIYRMSHSSLYVGLTGLAGVVPIVAFGLYGGAIADSMDRRRLSVAASLLTWSVTLLLLAQAVLGLHSVAAVLALVAVQSAGFAISSSARGAIIPQLVPEDMVAAANTLNFTTGNVAQVAGPLLAGVLVSLPHGFGYAYGADAVLFAGVLYATVRLPPIVPAAAARAGTRAVVEGLRFIAARPVLLTSFAVDIAAMTLAMPRALFPQAAQTRFHGGIGLLYASLAIGSVLAGLVSGWIGRVRRQGVALACAAAGWGAAMALAGQARTLWLAVLLLMLAGAADLVSAVYRQTMLQTYAPDEMRGRMQGVFTVVVSGGPPLGDLRAGSLAAATSLGVAWSGSSLLCVVLVLGGAVAVRPFWTYDAHADAPGRA